MLYVSLLGLSLLRSSRVELSVACPFILGNLQPTRFGISVRLRESPEHVANQKSMRSAPMTNCDYLRFI